MQPFAVGAYYGGTQMSDPKPRGLARWRDITAWLGRHFSSTADDIARAASSEKAAEAARHAAADAAPVIWLLGKVQSGKSSIVQRLTGASEVEVGEGFRPITRSAAIFDFPVEAPVLRFLDTRGLGEKDYAPAEDLAACEAHANLIIAVMRAGDHGQLAVLDPLREIRARHPDWPILVAQSWLHSFYPFPPIHPMPYPFTGTPADAELPGVAPDLGRVLLHQRRLFDAMPGTAPIVFVPIDFTRATDGLAPADFGLDALLSAIESVAPSVVSARLAAARAGEGQDIGSKAQALITGYAFTAAAIDVAPVAGMIGVPILQGAMLHALAGRFDVEFGRDAIIAFLGSLGTATVLRYALGFGLRQLVKMIPVYGQTAGAVAAGAASFAFTYALGQAACVYLAARRHGITPRDGEIVDRYARALKEAFEIFRRQKEKA